MKRRRIGLALAAFLVIANLAPALDIRPDPATGEVGWLPVTAAAIGLVLAVATVVLLVPAWRGRQWAVRAVALIQLLGMLQATPIFFVPAEVVPAGAVVFAALGALASLVAITLMLYDSSSVLLASAAVVVTVAIYAGLVAAVSVLLPAAAERSIQTASAIVVALLFAPILALMRRTVARSIYGGRVDPAGTAISVNQQRGIGEGAVQTAVEETRRALRLPRLELMEGGRTLAAAGARHATAARETLPVGNESGLVLVVTLRPGETRLHRDDRAALELVAAPFALLLRESALIAELRVARADAARAREAERATIHRELHDGLGPLLTGASYRLDAVRNQLDAAPQGVDADLATIGADLRTAIDEVRRVVYGLRPAELEQGTIWSAVRRHAGAVGADLSLPDPPPALSPAVELATFRIVTEGIANIERHAPGSQVTLAIECDGDAMRIGLGNAGVFEPPSAAGVGTTSMRDRAEELGGRFHAGPVAQGWLVSAELPLH
ncbi:sensor histidine kinase [Microbacterium sp. bgisy189]|uniref:sensor histidine kinase n=1 Tax=Microbacterium sp. bgisy189 TaxID=3413798 RepID=UPI003EBA5748